MQDSRGLRKHGGGSRLQCRRASRHRALTNLRQAAAARPRQCWASSTHCRASRPFHLLRKGEPYPDVALDLGGPEGLSCPCTRPAAPLWTSFASCCQSTFPANVRAHLGRPILVATWRASGNHSAKLGPGLPMKSTASTRRASGDHYSAEPLVTLLACSLLVSTRSSWPKSDSSTRCSLLVSSRSSWPKSDSSTRRHLFAP